MLPIVLVPIVFALLALAVMLVIQFVADRFSAVLSRVFNRMTHDQITRQALGNDTDGEIALGADSRPAWLPLAYPALPREVGDKIADYSNQNSFRSLAKFRNAISTLAFSESEDEGGGIITTYLTWRELIHTSYFEVPEFLKLLAYAVGHTDGFAAGGAFKTDPDFDRAERWYDAIRPHPVA